MSSASTSYSSVFDPPPERYLPTTCSAWWSLSSPPLPPEGSLRSEYRKWLSAVIHLLWDQSPELMSLLWQYHPYRACLDSALAFDSQSATCPLRRLHLGCVSVHYRLKVLQCFLQRQNCVLHHSNHGSCTEHATARGAGESETRVGRSGRLGWRRAGGGPWSRDGSGCYEISLCSPVFGPQGKLTLHSSCSCPPGCGEHGTPRVFADTLVELARKL